MTLTPPLFTQDLVYPASLLRLEAKSGQVAGTVNAPDMLVSPGSVLQAQIAPGLAYVPQSVSSEGSFYNGLYFVANDAIASPSNTITAPITNPRVDQIILQVNDKIEQGGSGASSAQYLWIPGTETSGATLANLSGAASLSAIPNCLRLAYVLQTVGESSLSSGNILNVAHNHLFQPARAHKGSAQTVASGTTLITIDTLDYDEIGGAMDVATNHQFVCPEAGYYRVAGQVGMTSTATAQVVSALVTCSNAVNTQINGSSIYSSAAAQSLLSVVDGLLKCVAGDTIQLKSSTNAALALLVSGANNFLSVQRVF